MGVHAIRDSRRGHQKPVEKPFAPIPTQSRDGDPPTPHEVIQRLRKALTDVYDLTERGLPQEQMIRAVRNRIQDAINGSVIV